MTTAYKAQRATAPKFMKGDGNSYCWHDLFVAAVALAVGDTIDFQVPAGADVTRVFVQCDDLDSNGTPTIAFKVGYAPVDTDSTLAAVDNYFAAAGQTTAQAGGRLECAFKPIFFNEDVYVRLTVTAAAATFQAGDIVVGVDGNCVGPK